MLHQHAPSLSQRLRQVAAAELLLNSGAAVDQLNKAGCTALHYAVRFGSAGPMLRLLVSEFNADSMVRTHALPLFPLCVAPHSAASLCCFTLPHSATLLCLTLLLRLLPRSASLCCLCSSLDVSAATSLLPTDDANPKQHSGFFFSLLSPLSSHLLPNSLPIKLRASK